MVRTATILVLCMVGAILVLTSSAHAASGVITTTSAQREAAAARATGKVHSPYHPGAAGPNRFDCSGLVTFAYRDAGTPLLGRNSFELWKHGAHVRRALLQRGDLVWTWDRDFGHVGIYVGNNQYVHAPGSGRRVEIATLPSGRAFVGAVRP